MPVSDADIETSVLRSARDKCYQARKSYFECASKAETGQPVVGPAVPVACKRERQAFEACCKDSWVKHFDTLHFKEQKFAQLVKQ